MNGLVACTVTAADTKISCVIRIFVKKAKDLPPAPEWQLIGGSLFDIFPYGTHGWWKIKNGRLDLVGDAPQFAVPYVPVGPVIMNEDEIVTEEPPNYATVAQLYNVPDSFLDSVTPQNTIRGEGTLFVTNEKLNWSMWYRTS